MRKIRIICDKVLLIQATVLSILMSVCCIGFILWVDEPGVAETPDDAKSAQMMFFSAYVIFVVAMFASREQFLTIVTLSKNGITRWTPFKKGDTFDYAEYPYVYIGKYFHSNFAHMGYDVRYIVLSQRRLSTGELEAINKLPNGREIIKIRYSIQKCEMLLSVLPLKLYKQLEKQMQHL